jgi:hypothetical protein
LDHVRLLNFFALVAAGLFGQYQFVVLGDPQPVFFAPMDDQYLGTPLKNRLGSDTPDFGNPIQFSLLGFFQNRLRQLIMIINIKYSWKPSTVKKKWG